MHAAKGLQFPVVVVARMDKGRFPMKAPAGIDPEDHAQQSRRLLFVACSRAMRRLMVVHAQGKPSTLLEGLDDIGLTMQKAEKIDAFEAKQRESQPWLYANG